MTDKNGTPTYESRVNDVIAATTKSEEGKLTFPENVDEGLKYAANAEMRRRDTQASYTRGQQEIKTLSAENSKLSDSWELDAVANIDATEQARLDELKTQDPDKWREELTNLEIAKRDAFKAKRTAVSQEANQLSELEQRQVTLETHNANNPNAQITNDVIENDIPPRITAELQAGTITFDQFLTKATKYITTDKVIAGTKPPVDEPDFANARGSNTPGLLAAGAQSASEYKDEIF